MFEFRIARRNSFHAEIRDSLKGKRHVPKMFKHWSCSRCKFCRHQCHQRSLPSSTKSTRSQPKSVRRTTTDLHSSWLRKFWWIWKLRRIRSRQQTIQQPVGGVLFHQWLRVNFVCPERISRIKHSRRNHCRPVTPTNTKQTNRSYGL